MLKFQEITAGDRAALDFIRTNYVAAFPAVERRPWDEYGQLLRQQPAYRLELLRSDARPVGFFSSWRLADFTFIEHFAVAAEHRGCGLGSLALKGFIARCPGQLILEVEPPATSPAARRRIAFYQRAGFDLEAGEYLQPAYVAGGAAVRLKLMSFPAPISDLAVVKAALYEQVYRR